MEARRFYLDTARRQFVGSPDSSLPAAGDTFFAEDVEKIELFFLKPTGLFSDPYAYLDYSANTVKFAVGATAPAALQTAWTALDTAVTTAVTELVKGAGSTAEVQQLTFSQSPASGNFALQLPEREIAVASVATNAFVANQHGLLNGQQVTLSGFTTPSGFANSTSYFVTDRTANTFRIATSAGGTPLAVSVASGGGTATLGAIATSGLRFNATAQQVQSAFAAVGLSFGGAEQIIVTGSVLAGFVFTFTGTQLGIDFDDIEVIGSSLAAAPGLGANVSFNTSEVAALITAGAITGLRLEVEVSDGTIRQTYATTASISSDIITSTSPTPLPANASFLLQSTSHTWSVSIDDDGILAATKQ
jgi:hypothetical protein